MVQTNNNVFRYINILTKATMSSSLVGDRNDTAGCELYPESQTESPREAALDKIDILLGHSPSDHLPRVVPKTSCAAHINNRGAIRRLTLFVQDDPDVWFL